MLVLLASLALASSDTPFTLGAGLGAAAAMPSVGAIGQAHLRWNARHFGVDVSGREGLMSSGTRTVGGLSVGGRWSPRAEPGGPFVRASFAHHHETPIDLALQHPITVLMGTRSGIVHRTGFELGLGWEWELPERMFGPRLGVVVEASATWFPDQGGPPLYLGLEPQLVYHVGRRRSAATLASDGGV